MPTAKLLFISPESTTTRSDKKRFGYVVLLVRRVSGLLPVHPAIVNLSREKISLIEERNIADIKANLTTANPLAIKVELTGVANTSEFKKVSLAPAHVRQVKVLPVPGLAMSTRKASSSFQVWGSIASFQSSSLKEGVFRMEHFQDISFVITLSLFLFYIAFPFF